MKSLGNFRCPQCGWVHSGISEAEAIASVAEFNKYFKTLSLQAQAEFGGKPSSLDLYKRCFKCGVSTALFLPASHGDAPFGCTLQVVIAPDLPRKVRFKN